MTETRDTIVALAGTSVGFVLGLLAGNAIGRLAADVASEHRTFESEDGQRIHIHSPNHDTRTQREIRDMIRESHRDDRNTRNGRN